MSPLHFDTLNRAFTARPKRESQNRQPQPADIARKRRSKLEAGFRVKMVCETLAGPPMHVTQLYGFTVNDG